MIVHYIHTFSDGINIPTRARQPKTNTYRVPRTAILDRRNLLRPNLPDRKILHLHLPPPHHSPKSPRLDPLRHDDRLSDNRRDLPLPHHLPVQPRALLLGPPDYAPWALHGPERPRRRRLLIQRGFGHYGFGVWDFAGFCGLGVVYAAEV